MATVATLETRMALNSTAFRAGMVQAANQANASLSSIQKQAGATASVLLSLKRAANTFGSFYLVKEGLSSLIDAQKQLQAIHFTLIAATGSSTQAADSFKFVVDASERLGLVLPNAAEGFANLSASATAAGVSLRDQKELFDAYAKSATSLHLDTTQSNRALLALEQMFAKGKVQAQELRLQLGQAIPGAAQRFQNAVLQMTKGTDLAGKSFDQLLQDGDLTTSKFLPALVSALQTSGRGWEDAAQGLNAGLNRVSTEWFKLKTQVSGGLFNDLATAGANALASSLSSIASSIAVIGAGGLARVLGGTINTGVSKVGRLAQETQGSRMAAAAETAYAEAQVAEARAAAAAATASRDAAAQKLAVIRTSQVATQQVRAEAQATFQAAAATKAKADSDVARLAGSTLSANNRFASQQAAASAAAQAQLARARATYNTALAGSNALMAEASVSQSALNKANITLIASEEALAVAQARVAETRAAEVAANSLGAAVRRTAASFGNFAQSLVGGPWGVALLTIGGLGYAFYKVKKQAEDWRVETGEQVKALQLLADNARAAADEYGRLGSSQTLSQSLDVLGTSTKELADKREELEQLQAQAAKLRATLELNAAAPNAGTAVSSWFDQRKLAQVTDRIKELQDQMPGASNETARLSDQLRGALTPAVDGLRRAIENVKAGGGLKGFIEGLASPSDIADARKAIESAQQQANSAVSAITALGERAHKDLLTKGVGRLAQGKAELALAIEGIKAQRLTAQAEAAAIGAATAEFNKQKGTLIAADIRDNAKRTTSAIHQEAEAYANLKNAQEGALETLRGQLAGTDGYSDAQKTLNTMLAGGSSEFRKLSAAHKAETLERQKGLVALQKEVDQRNLSIASAKQLAELDRQLADEQADRDRANARKIEGVGHGAQWNEEREAQEAIADAYRKKKEEADKAYQSAVAQATVEGKLGQLQAQLDEQHAQALGKIVAAQAVAMDQQQKAFDDLRAANADWGKGFQSAIEDFQVQQQNNAATARKMVDDVTTGSVDAITAIVTRTQTARQAIGGFFDDLYIQAVRFLANKAIQALFDSFGASGKAATPGSTAGGLSSWFSNFSNALGLSGAFGPGTIGAGLANGGQAHAWGTYSVAENGPELLKVGNRNLLMMGDQAGTVVPNNQLRAAEGNTYVTHINLQPTTRRRTAEQIARVTARELRMKTARSGG